VIYLSLVSRCKRGPAVSLEANRLMKKELTSIFLKGRRRGDKIFRGMVVAAAGYSALMLILVAYAVVAGALPIFFYEGLYFISGTDWNAVYGRESFGAFPYIIGTLLSSSIAMAIGVPISLGIAIFVSEMAPRKLSTPLSFVVELLAAVPSIIYGLWALFVFRLWIRDLIERPLHDYLGWIPFFDKTPFGLDVFSAGIVLSIMIIPIVSSITREIMLVVPNSQREAAYSLGATRWGTLRIAIFPYAKSGLLGASFLGLGRAIGETILVTMIIGNAIGPAAIPTTLFSQGQSLASLIANEFNEAASDLHLSALIGLGAILLLLSMVINIGARFMVSRMVKVMPGSRE
jgi:phosphate transport system permease protein